MPQHDPTKTPSDAKIMRAFKQFEDAYVIAEAVFNNAPELAYVKNEPAVDSDRYDLQKAHRVMMNLARKANERIEVKKGDQS